EAKKPGYSRVAFNITEDPVARVSKIEFVGNTFEPYAVLRTHLDTSQQCAGLPIGTKFNDDMANHDVKNLEEYYHKYGFFDVVVRREFRWDPDQQHVRVIFHIQEGRRFKVSNLDVVHNQVMDSKSLLDMATSHQGDVYNKLKS